jgi:hypothetical protein
VNYFGKRTMIRITSGRLLAAIAAVCGWPVAVHANAVPQSMQGNWAVDGKCTILSKRLVLTATTATFGNEKPAEVEWRLDDGPGGEGALHWVKVGVVSNMEYVAEMDLIRFNRLGWGMGEPVIVYRRCAQ